ncbi:MAG: ArpU family phage packaging/lysis transcriptional regulator [Aerococcus sp.]|nr:ArpU family phage packaging/lysis transcriptional regulator [Aerococcus sp.]
MLFPEIDSEKTIEQVDQLLSRYHMIRRLAGEPIPQKLTTAFSQLPKSVTNDNLNEQRIFDKIDGERLFADINRALLTLDQSDRHLLWSKYIAGDGGFDYEAYSQMHIGKTTYYQRLNRARLCFAEAYHRGELLVFKR